MPGIGRNLSELAAALVVKLLHLGGIAGKGLRRCNILNPFAFP